MSKTVTTTTTVTVSGDGFSGAPLYSESIVNTTGLAPGQVNTANGFVSVAVPAAALGVLVVPPPTSALVKTYKGITGDTGIPTAATGSTRFVWTAGQLATLGIACTGVEALELIWL